MAAQKFIEGDIADGPNGEAIIFRQGRWYPHTENKSGGAPGFGFDGATSNYKYQDAVAKQRADADVKRIDAAGEMERTGYENEATAKRAEEVMNNRTPTGWAADQRIGLGKAIGNGFTRAVSLGFIPDKDETANLETMRTLGNQGALGQVGQLKGPLSDRDVAFIKTLQYDAGASPTQNRRVIDAQKWVARRQAGYAAALRAWTQNLGSPSALNPKGQTFDGWWGGYSAKKIPAPGLSSGAPKKSITANAPRKTTSGGYEVLSVRGD